MNIASRLTPGIAAGAVLAAALLILLGNDAADQAAPIQALSRAPQPAERQGRVRTLDGTERESRAQRVGAARVADTRTTPDRH